MMLHIVLLILKITGIIVLVVIGILLLLLLSVLFVPVRYKCEGSAEKEKIQAEGKVSWLFHMICVKAEYVEKKLEKEVYVFGIPVLSTLAKKKKRKKKKRQKVEPKERNTDLTTEKKDPEKPHEKITKPENLQPDRESRKKEQKEKTKKPGWSARIKDRWKNIKSTKDRICGNIERWREILAMDETKYAFREVVRHGRSVIGHILPTRFHGRIRFGFDDPATTGQVLGAVGMFYPVYRETLSICPVFDHQVFEGDVKFKGRIIPGYILFHLWQAYRTKEIKKTYGRIRHKEEE